MRTKSGKLAASRMMASSNSAAANSYTANDDPRVKDMWDEEFFGHKLPPKYKISKMNSAEGLENKSEYDDKRDLIGERAMWDEEFWGHSLPPNYTISRFRTPDALEKKETSSRREMKLSNPQQQSIRFQPHARTIVEDTFEYSFDKTLDSYVLSEEVSGRKDACGMSQLECGPVLSKGEEGPTVETFEDRALRFGVEDWNLVCKKWTVNESKGNKRSGARRGIFHSPSGSETSSLISTLESSSFSCGSEGSSFAKSEFSSTSFNLSYVYGVPGGAGMFPAAGRHSVGARTSIDGQFVELNILERENLGDVPDIRVEGVDVSHGNSYLEFNFLDGRLVETEDGHKQKETMSGTADGKASSRLGQNEDPRSDKLAVVAVSDDSPDSENFFDSSHDSDWSATHSTSTTDQRPGCGRDPGEAPEFEEDAGSNFTEDRGCEDWSSDSHYFDVEASIPCSCPPLGLESEQGAVDSNLAFVESDEGAVNSNSEGEGGDIGAITSNLEVVESDQGAVNLCNDENRMARPPKKILTTTPRKIRSLGSVLSHHLAFTAVPSLRYKAQTTICPAELKGSPAKVTAACIEWLWTEKDSKKPVHALRALASGENVARERIASLPVRNLDAAFRESRTIARERPQSGLDRTSADVYYRTDRSPLRVRRDATRESRDSILASWAAVNGTGESGASRSKRPTVASGKVALSTTPTFKPLTRGGVSPKKRSLSFGAYAGSKSGTSLSKPVSRNLSLELEVLCRPFGPVLKGVRFLPTAKRGLGRPPLFSNLGPQLASSSSASSTALPSVLKCGRLQCVVTREGLPSYSLIMDDTEEIFAAKSLRVDVGVQEGVSHLYTFHTLNGKGKGKSVWRQWGKKEKPGSDFAGNMTVTSTIRPVVTSSGVQNFVESEFVLFDAKVREISISGPTTTSPYPRSSFSSWDTATPHRSPQGPSSTYSSPSSTYFSLPSPGVPAGAFSTPLHPTPSQTVPLSIPTTGTTLSGLAGLDRNSIFRLKQLERRASLESPSLTNPKMGNAGFRESSSDSESHEDFDSQIWGMLSSHSQCELAAVVVRTPMEKNQGKVSPTGDKWGWGINFLRKSFDGMLNGSSPDQGVPCALGAESAAIHSDEDLHGSMEKFTTPKHQRCNSCGSASGDEAQVHGGLNITLILPSGEHGCSANGMDGPQPLIERWRSGGKCDCGSWDLGCGLRVVENYNVDDKDSSFGKSQSRDNTLRLFLEGKKQQVVGLALTPMKDGSYSLGFQSPVFPLHAFATAVAILHSKNPVVSSKKPSESKRRLTRIPVKVVPSSARPFSRQSDELAGSRPLVSYKLVCPDPPSSPFGRA